MVKFSKAIENRIGDVLELIEMLQDVADACEEKYTAIEDKRADKDRDMTEREQERYDELETQQSDIQEAIDNLESALYVLDEYLNA